MSKQTAVEWLVEKLDQNFDYVADTIIDQAKAMEKEQIIKSNRDGVDMVICQTPFITGEDYYNENYGETKN
jgi:hypothetical protein